MATSETPLMTQYKEMKAKHPDAILLFRVGDFYETFGDDAITCSELLGITLTRRSNGNAPSTELAGFPHHALDTYLPRLVRAGKRVAICEQQEDAHTVVEKITPGPTPAREENESQELTPEQNKKDPIKRINCTQNLSGKGEPIAWFTIDIPREVKNIGKCTAKDSPYPALSSVCIEPERNKLIASDTKILQTVDVVCKGEWPSGTEITLGDRTYYRPFQCNIDPMAINHLAGKRVDVAVWQKENGELDVTACETEGVLTQYDETIRKNNWFPDWQRIVTQDSISLCLTPESVRLLFEWVRENVGKRRPAKRENALDVCNMINIKLHEGTPKITFTMYGTPDHETSKRKKISDIELSLTAPAMLYADNYYFAHLFFLSIDGDFNGHIDVSGNNRFLYLHGDYRTSALSPLQYNPN